MSPSKQSRRQSKVEDLIDKAVEEEHSKLVSELDEGGMRSSSNSEEFTLIRKGQYQLLVVVSNLSAKFDLLLKSRMDGLENREGIGTSMVRVPAIGVDGRDHVQGVQGRPQEMHPVLAGMGRPCDDLLQGLHRQAQQEEQTMFSDGWNQQELPRMGVPTLLAGGRLQAFLKGLSAAVGNQDRPRFGMEHVRKNTQEGFQHVAPPENCLKGPKMSFHTFDGSKELQFCYQLLKHNPTSYGDDRLQGTHHQEHQQGNMQSSMLNSHFQQQQHHFRQQQQNLEQQQLQQQQQQLTQFSQGMTMSKLLQNSDDFPSNEQRIRSQERDLSWRKLSSIQPISYVGEDSQIPMSRTSTNGARRWNSTPDPDEKCHVNEEVGCRRGLMETSISRLGMILDAVQSDVMQVNRSVKEVVLGNEGLQQKLVMQDKTLLQTVKVQEDIKSRIESDILEKEPIWKVIELDEEMDNGFSFLLEERETSIDRKRVAAEVNAEIERTLRKAFEQHRQQQQHHLQRQQQSPLIGQQLNAYGPQQNPGQQQMGFQEMQQQQQPRLLSSAAKFFKFHGIRDHLQIALDARDRRPSKRYRADFRPLCGYDDTDGRTPKFDRKQSMIYTFVAKGNVVLAEHTSISGNFSTIVVQWLQKLPSTSNKFTYSCDGHTFNFLVDSGFVFLVVADEATGKSIPFVFLDRMKEDFMNRYGARISAGDPHSLDDDDDGFDVGYGEGSKKKSLKLDKLDFNFNGPAR